MPDYQAISALYQNRYNEPLPFAPEDVEDTRESFVDAAYMAALFNTRHLNYASKMNEENSDFLNIIEDLKAVGEQQIFFFVFIVKGQYLQLFLNKEKNVLFGAFPKRMFEDALNRKNDGNPEAL